MHDGARHAECARRVADGQVSGLLKVGRCHVSGGAPQPLPRRADSGEASANPLRDSSPLKFGQGGKDVELKSTSGCRAVDALAQRHERDADGLHVLQQRDEVLQIAPESVQTPDHQDIESPTPGIRN